MTVSVRMNRFLWIEDLIALIGEGVAPPPDPAGPVESMCRRVGSVLAASDAFDWYKVVVKNIASGYAAFASSEWPEPAETAAIHCFWRPSRTAPCFPTNPTGTDCDA